jgi:hypothetical protein
MGNAILPCSSQRTKGKKSFTT